jgi:hypothetical protein
METTPNILCPCCDTRLVYTHSDRYQDLSEHVSQPNREPSMKAAYQCPNDECIAKACDVSWIEDGEFYTGKRPEGMTYTELIDALEKKHGVGYAVNSWYYHYEIGKKAIKNRRKEIKFWKYRVVIEPKEFGHSYPIEKQYQPKRFGWKFEWWKTGSDEGCWIHLTPIHRMVNHYLRSFNSSYKSAIYNPTANRSQIKDALEYALGNRWGTKDDRSFARISAFIIQTFQPNKVKTLINLAKEQNIKI